MDGHSTPSLKISCKSVQPFSRNLADKETNKDTYTHTYKQTKKSIENNTLTGYTLMQEITQKGVTQKEGLLTEMAGVNKQGHASRTPKEVILGIRKRKSHS